MQKYRSYLWNTCRVIANETRLSLLWQIFEQSRNICVGDLSTKLGLSLPNASNQLKVLRDEGFIISHRSGQTVFYTVEPERQLPHINQLTVALQKSNKKNVSFSDVIRQATGFTHQRRIEIFCKIAAAPLTLDELLENTPMSYAALSRHLKKLESREYIIRCKKQYCQHQPSGLLAKALIAILTD